VIASLGEHSPPLLWHLHLDMFTTIALPVVAEAALLVSAYKCLVFVYTARRVYILASFQCALPLYANKSDQCTDHAQKRPPPLGYMHAHMHTDVYERHESTVLNHYDKLTAGTATV
jgi:hypothetical protein